ncbi:hypothetical protein ACES2L_11180 [Bdellovibrio bacteriovorus]
MNTLEVELMIFSLLLSVSLLFTVGCSFKKNPSKAILNRPLLDSAESKTKPSEIDRLFLDLRIQPIDVLLKNLDKVSINTLESRDSENLTVLDHAIARGNGPLVKYLLSRNVSPFRFKNSAEKLTEDELKTTNSNEEEVNNNPDEISLTILAAQKSKLKEIENSAWQIADINIALKLVRDTESAEHGCISVLDGIQKSRNEVLRKNVAATRNYVEEIEKVLKNPFCDKLNNVSGLIQKHARVWLSEELKNLYILEVTSDENFGLYLIKTFNIENAVVHSNAPDGAAVSPTYLISLVKDCRYRLNPKKQEWLNLIGVISDKTALSSEYNVYDPPDEEYLRPGIPIGQLQLVKEKAEEDRAANRKNAIESLGIGDLLASKKFETCEKYYEE